MDCVDGCPSQALSYQAGKIVRDKTLCSECLHCVDICPTTAWEKIGWEISSADLLNIVLKDQPFFDESGGGVTCSGGEPLQQTDFLLAFFQAARQRGLHTVLDTCGYVSLEKLKSILPVTDLILFDLKLMDSELHEKYTGVGNCLILDHLKMLSKTDQEVGIRFPLIPDVNDVADNVTSMIRFLSEETRFRSVDILPYHHTAEAKYERLNQDYRLKKRSISEPSVVKHIFRQFSKAGFEVKIGG